MTHVHSHGHVHGGGGAVATGADRRPLALALTLIAALMAVEVAAGIAANSLALLADAAHMLTDAAALAMALGAAVMGARPAAGHWTWGFRRLEVLAAQVNGATLGVLGLWIVWSAIHRLISPEDVRGGVVLVVALAGVAGNLAATAVLAPASRHSINVPRAVLHHRP